MLSIVVPVWNEGSLLPDLLDELIEVLSTVEADWEIVLVDDGSTDETWAIILGAAARDPRLRGLRLSRNFGHQIALTAGLRSAEGDAVITMDGDLQHPPALIPSLLAKAGEGFDVVYAVRSPRDGEGRFKVGSARFFYWLLNRLTALDLPHGGADYRYMSRRVVDVLLAMPERHRFLRGMSRWVGFSQSAVEYDRPSRRAGKSRYTVTRMARFALDAILSFSSLPLRIASVLGIVVSILGGIYFLYVLGVRLFTDDAVPGWTSVVVLVLILGGAQLACIGIMGQYVGRMYEEIKGRPLFVVRDDTRDVLRRANAEGEYAAGAVRSALPLE